MDHIFRFSGAVGQDPAVAAWFDEHGDELGAIARRWFEVIRACGGDVRELRHVKLRPDDPTDAAALTRLIEAAYTDMKRRVQTT